MGAMDIFKGVLIIQLFYAFMVTMIALGVSPLGSEVNQVFTPFNDLTTSINLEDISSDVKGSVQEQTNVPSLELGSLIFFSGNIVIDLLLNFIFAVPEMLSLLTYAIGTFINLDARIMNIIQLFGFVFFSLLYFLSIISFVTNTRSGRGTI